MIEAGQGGGLLQEQLAALAEVLRMGVADGGDGAVVAALGQLVGHVLLDHHLLVTLFVMAQVDNAEATGVKGLAYPVVFQSGALGQSVAGLVFGLGQRRHAGGCGR